MLGRAAKSGWDRLEAFFDAHLGRDGNPLNQLGALTVFFFWVVLVSGIYVFVFFRTSVEGAYDSVEELTYGQWYLGGVMRSLHRYASDAAIVTIALHMVREFVRDRYHGARWFSWFTGVPQLWLVFPLGITGYWMVWDQLAAHVALVSAEVMDWLPIFTDPMARNFLTNAEVSDRFFTLLAFVHLLGLPMLLLFGIWFHVLRITQPKVNPSRRVMIGSLAALVVLSFVLPAESQGRADLGYVPASYDYDWFYLFMYPLHDRFSPGLVWGLLFGSSLFISMLPWLPRRKREPVPEVDPDNCNGCTFCFADCPYSAITMVPHPNGKPGVRMAAVDPANCVSCGICVGACPSATPFRRADTLVSGIDFTDTTVNDLRMHMEKRADALTGRPRVLVFGCNHAASLDGLADEATATQQFSCIGTLPPTFVDYAIRRLGVDGVLITGCPPEASQHRLGSLWVEERFSGKREPHLKRHVPSERYKIVWARASEPHLVKEELAKFREELAALDTKDAGNA